MRSIIIGAGTYGEVYLAYLRESGIEVIGFADDDPVYENKEIRGVPVLGAIRDLQSIKDGYEIEAVYCPIGSNKLRVHFLDFARSLGLKTPSYIHPSVCIAPDVSIADEGVYILQNTQIMPYVRKML
jgi:FlaA1/EpsC-like NDP-sugar epimerase